MPSTIRRLSIALVCAFLGGAASTHQIPVRPQARPDLPTDIAADAIERGRLLTATACAGCHATGATGQSPMQEATPFREIVHRYPLDQLEEAFAEGLVTSHPAMPEYTFRASEIDDLIAYLESVKTEP